MTCNGLHARREQVLVFSLTNAGHGALDGQSPGGAHRELVVGCSSPVAALSGLVVELEQPDGARQGITGAWKAVGSGGPEAGGGLGATGVGADGGRGGGGNGKPAARFSKLWWFEPAAGAGALGDVCGGGTVRIRSGGSGGEGAPCCLQGVSGCDVTAFEGCDALVDLCLQRPRAAQSVVVGRTGEAPGDVAAARAADEEERAVLEEHLSLCRELLEIEPGCKWALLTELYLLSLVQQAQEARDLGAREGAAADDASLTALRETGAEIQRVGAELVEVDNTRRCYYTAVMSRADLRLACAMAARAGGAEARMSGWSLVSLAAPSLVRLVGIHVLDVSDNKLVDLDGVEVLYGLERLVADGCCLGSLAALRGMARLQSLSIRRNGIKHVAPLLQPIAHLACLRAVDVGDNAGAADAPCRMAGFDLVR